MQMFLSDLMMEFSIETFLTNANDSIQRWAGLIVTIIGAVMMLAGIWKIGKGFISDKAQTNWPMAIGALVLGGVLLLGGWNLLRNTSSDIADELNGMGGGNKTDRSGPGASIVYMVD